MFKPYFKDYGLSFTNLTDRDTTDLLVIHHTGNPKDDNISAESLHESHLNKGWAGIGYHFVIRKNGSIELGRPMDAIGSHAYGYNSHSIGIHLCGNFNLAEPTNAQIESCAVLLAWLMEQYDLPVSSIVGHQDLDATSCPGENLFSKMDTLKGKAAWYLKHYQNGYYDGL